jgi:hypothetical protein
MNYVIPAKAGIEVKCYSYHLTHILRSFLNNCQNTYLKVACHIFTYKSFLVRIFMELFVTFIFDEGW